MFKFTPVDETVNESVQLSQPDDSTVGCVSQFLVIDRPDGPAHLLIELLSRLFDGKLAYVIADYDTDMLTAVLDNLNGCRLLILGLEYHLPTIAAQVSQLPAIQMQYPALKMMGVARQLSPAHLAYYQRFGLETIVELPRRASELKTLARTFAQRYFPTDCQ